MTTILDTTTSDTGTVVNFSENDKRNPQGIIIGLDIGSGDTLTVYTKTGTLGYRADPDGVYTVSQDVAFNSVPDSIRVDRTVDGGSADSTAVITQVD